MIPFANRLLAASFANRGGREDSLPHAGASLHHWRFPASPQEAVEGAPPLLLLHGLGDSSLTWVRVLPRLPRRAPIWAFDLPSFGGSGLPPAARTKGFSSIAEHADAVAAMLRHVTHLSGAPPLVVAHSLGAWVALKALAREPGLAAGLLAVSGAGLRYEGIEDLRRLEAATTPEAVLALWKDMWHRLPPMLSRFAPEVTANMRSPAIQGLVRSVTEADLVDPAAVPRGLLLGVVWGASDRLVPPEAGRALADATGAPFHLLPAVGHVPQLEDPEHLAALIERTWRSLG